MKPATSDLLVIEPPKKEFMIKPQILWGYGDMLGYDLVHTYKKSNRHSCYIIYIYICHSIYIYRDIYGNPMVSTHGLQMVHKWMIFHM